MKKIRSKRKCIAVLILLLTVFIMVLYYAAGISGFRLNRSQVVECESGSTFAAKLQEISGLQVSVDDQDYQFGDLRISLTDADGKTLLDQQISSAYCGRWSYGEKIDLLKTVSLQRGSTYTLSFESGGHPYDCVTVRLYEESISILPYYLVVCALLLFLEMLCLFAFLRGIRHRNLAVVSVMLILFALCMIVTPPLGIPDEPTHFSATYYVAGKLMGQGTEQGVPIRETGAVRGPGGVQLQEGLNFFTDTTGNETAPEGAAYAVSASGVPSYCYLPGAVGVLLARLLHLPWQWIIVLGRLTNGMFAVLITLLAVRLLPSARYAILGYSMLPSCIWLYDSFSYDVWSLSLTMLFVVLILRLREQDRDVRLLDLVLPAVILVLFAPIKYVYVVLGLAVLLIPRRHWKKRLVLPILGIFLAVAAAMLLLRGREFIGLLTTGQRDTRSNAYVNGLEAYTIGYVVRHPLNTLLVFLNTLITKTQSFADRMVSGELYTTLPVLIMVCGIVLVGLIFACGMRGMHFRKRERAYAAVIFILGCAAVYAAFLFVYSGIPASGIGVIDGMQGRYFLPFLPMLFVVLHSDRMTQRLDRVTENWNVSTEQGLLLLLIALNGLCQFYRFLHLASLL